MTSPRPEEQGEAGRPSEQAGPPFRDHAVAPSDGPVPPADGRPEPEGDPGSTGGEPEAGERRPEAEPPEVQGARPDTAEPAGDQDPSVEAEYEAATERPGEVPATGTEPKPGPSGGGEVEPAEAAAPPFEEADPLAVAERERDEYLALAQRTQADFDNFRRRAAKDAAAAGARAKAGLVRELLPAVDNLERALAAAPEAEEGLAHGVRLVHAELIGALERSGVEPVEPVGAPFDPNEHEALSVREGDGQPSGVVLDVVEKGYKLAGTVVRPARVIVSA